MIRTAPFLSREQYETYLKNNKSLIQKHELILTLAQGRSVLDLGCIDHGWKRATNLGDAWLHKRLKGVAKELVGLDLLGDDARILNAQGYHIIEGDVEDFDLKRTFEVIVCGDIIEHLSNVGRFLNCVSQHMDEQSVCVISTPNPFNIEQFMLCLFHGRISVNGQHTIWLDPSVLFESVRRSELRLVDFFWIETGYHFPVVKRFYGRLINGFSRWVMKRRPLCRRDYAVLLRRPVRGSCPL